MKKIACFIIAILTLLYTSFNVYGEQSCDFTKCQYTKFNDAQKWEILELEKNCNFSSSPIIGGSVVAITATTQDYIAVALKNGTILIYKNGLLYNTLKINTAYGSYFVFSKDENLIIYIYRGYCYEIAVDGECINIIDFDEKDHYTSNFLREKAAVTSVEVNEKIYERKHYGISNLIGDAGYCKVIESSQDGEMTLYESFGPRLHGLFLLMMFIIAFFIVPIFILQNIRKHKGNPRTQGDGSLS